mgnify:CR=1 FL=1
MQNIESKPFQLFLHIHKTAGTTLRKIVDFQYGHQNVLTFYNQNSNHLIDNLDSLLIVNPRYKALIGHFNFGVHKKISFPTTYTTFLRHPVARTISHYKEWLVNHPDWLLDENGNTQNLIQNIHSNPENYSDFQCKMLTQSNSGANNIKSLGQMALDNLSTYFSGIGLVEYFDESITLLSKKLGWKPSNYSALNVKNIDLEITAELTDLILSINTQDLFMYETIEKKLINDFK